ncbi:hypothetical protein FsymDg_2156 [Candidatus Protofrankia datiscae]|uniref:Transposase IS4 N-terminal domain-containing protein n=1 Tax=Candidatus Protofrankia datiscae TaxID=2716812 RepID=F8AYX9_9ACTN|nr:hypothetical protein FsymDg_2156 [Candidatus Protofrankia datiscae]
MPAVDNDRLTDRISIGVLARIVPRDLVEEVLVETKRQERRTRLLPARVMVYFTMTMCLFFDDDYEEVMRKLAGALRWLGNWQGDWESPDHRGDLAGTDQARCQWRLVKRPERA